MAATIAAIESFENPLILIMGGIDKGNTNFSQLSPSLVNRVKHIITYGQAGEAIKEQINATINITYVEEFKAAVLQASEKSKPGDIILLSPACACFDQFSNYEDRGNAFKHIFNNLELSI